MKVLITSLLLFFATATALASIDPQDITVHRDATSNTMIVRSTIPLDGAAAFNLYDDAGNLVYTDSLIEGAFINKRFPLKNLAGKSFQIVLTGTNGRTTLPFSLKSTDGYLANYAEASFQAFPKVDLREERTLVVDYTNTCGKRVNIRIADRQGKTVFSDQITGTTTVQRAYQLGQLAEGDYEVTVSARDVKHYTTAIALR